MAADKRRSLLLTLLIHSSLADFLDASTDNLGSYLSHGEKVVQSSIDDQLNIYGQSLQIRMPRNLNNKTHRQFVSAINSLINSKFDDEKYDNKSSIPINDKGDAVGKKIHKEPGTKMNNTFSVGGDTPPKRSRSTVFQNGGWALTKSTLLTAVNALPHQDEIFMLEGVKLLLDIGDKMHFAQSFVDKLEPSLADFLYDIIRLPMMHLTNVLVYLGLSNDNSNHWNNIKQLFGSDFVKFLITEAQDIIKAHFSVNELKKYYTLLQENNPMAAQALDFILNLFPDASRWKEGRSFFAQNMHDSYERVDNKLDRHDEAYGGHGSYDSGYGHSGGGYRDEVSYHQSYHHIDPYLLLAALGAATLLSYIAYLVLTTTAVVPRNFDRKRYRSLDFFNDEDLSDRPEVLYSVTNMIETAGHEYGEEAEGMVEDLSSSLNSLWHMRQYEGGCMRCALGDRVMSGLGRLSLQHLLMSGAAQLMGADKVGSLLDELMAPVSAHLGSEYQNPTNKGPPDGVIGPEVIREKSLQHMEIP